MARTKNKQIKVPIPAFNAMRELARQAGSSESRLYREAIGEYLQRHGYDVNMLVEVGNPNLRYAEDDEESNKTAPPDDLGEPVRAVA